MKRSLFFAMLTTLVTGVPALAKTQALLFGVSSYPQLPAEKSLSAPGNDVRRMKQALLARGVAGADMTVLADGIEGSIALPTRQAILDQLARLGREAVRGDTIIIYGSGHGSRQKSTSGRKVDGMDQLFLPRDIVPDTATGRFANAIVSVEFGEHLDAIRRKGADVWFVLDSCFSGGATRAVGEGVHDKMIDPSEIGLSVSTNLATSDNLPLAEAPALPPGSGKLVAFYASQPNETAREVALPPHLPLEKRSWGSIFTLALTKVMARAPSLSYRQTMVETGRVLRADPSFQARQTPSFEGDGLDAAMIGGSNVDVAAMWRITGGILNAGQLEGVEEGALVSLYESADAASGKALGVAVVDKAESLQATLVALRAGCDPFKANCPRDAANAALAKAAYARLLKPAEGAVLKIASPRARPGAPPPSAVLARLATESLAAVLTTVLAQRVVQDDGAPDLVTWMDADGLRFMPNGIDPTRAESGPFVPLREGVAADDARTAIARALLRARQILNVQRLEQAAATGAADLALALETRHYRYDAASKQCQIAAGDPGEPVVDGASIEMCDKITVTIENQGRRTMMPAVFFLDDAWNVIARRPTCPVGLTVADRLEPGRRLTFEVPYHPRAFKPGRSAATMNGVFVLGVPFREGATDVPNVCGLTAYNDRAGDAAMRGEAGDDLDQLIAGTTRGGRLALDTAYLALSFWSVKQPVRN